MYDQPQHPIGILRLKGVAVTAPGKAAVNPPGAVTVQCQSMRDFLKELEVLVRESNSFYPVWPTLSMALLLVSTPSPLKWLVLGLTLEVWLSIEGSG